ncbi:MAG: single-stranded DNA-binding protein [Wolinella sp.]
MFNKVILVGNLTRDVELRYLPSGSALAKVGIATNRQFKKQDGSQGEEVCFIDVTLFGRSAEVANQYLKKGSKVLIEGRLVLDTWTDQSGQKHSKHSVSAESMKMLDGKGGNRGGYDGGDEYATQGSAPSYGAGGGNSYNAGAQNARPQRQAESQIPEIDIDDEEVPF